MKRKTKLLFASLAFMLISITAFSQGKGPEPPAPPPPPGAIPIDGGLTLLIVAGVAYGVYEKRRKK